MAHKNKILGIVTARGGSKRMPRKNIKDFFGKPLLAWTIEIGIESGVLDRLVLSTEDEEIAGIGRRYGAEVPFTRPQELATDVATSYATVKHAVEWLRDNENYETEWIVLLEPASPGRQPFHIHEVTNIVKKGGNFDSIVGISETPGHYSYVRALQKDDNNIISRAWDGKTLGEIIYRTQDIKSSYFMNAQIYAFKTANLFDGKNSLWGNSTYGYLMDGKYAIDIDTPADWLIAEVKMKNILSEKNANKNW